MQPDTISLDAAAAAALVKNTADNTAMALNIQYMQRDITEIKQTLKDGQLLFVSNTEFKEYKDDTIDHESRIKKIEELIIAVDANNSYKSFLDLKQEVRDFKTSANVFRIIAGFVGGSVVFMLIQIPNILKSFGILK